MIRSSLKKLINRFLPPAASQDADSHSDSMLAEQLKPDYGEFVEPGHFYSAVPSKNERDTYILPSASSIPGIELNTSEQIARLKRFKNYHDQCSFPEHKQPDTRYYFENPAYSYTDALVLHSMIREYEPARIIEVGSGFSSCMTLDTNDLCFNGNIELTFIEPYPELLHSLINPNDNRHKIIPQPLQNVDLSLFEQLQENDILFIDSTHVLKLNSDVCKILFEILPLLNSGVVIHFHDIFWPFTYPVEWIQEGRAWNEAYALRAFLQYNLQFEILFFSQYLYSIQSEWINENLPLYAKNNGANLWLRKR